MRLTSIICAILLVSGALYAVEPPPVEVEGFSVTHMDEAHDPEYDALASGPGRPEWAPLPVFRGAAEMAPVLHEMLRSGDAESRAQAAFLLGQIGLRDSVSLLEKALKAPERAVRVQAGIALACMGNSKGIPVCAAALKADAPWMRYYAAYGLWCVNGPRAKRILKESDSGQWVLVSQAIQGALKSPHVAPKPGKASASKGKSMTADEILEAVGDAYVRESEWWWHHADYEQGIRCMEALVFVDRTDVQSFGIIAWLHRNLGRPAESFRVLNRAIEANPDDPSAWFELGFVYMGSKDYTHAEEPLRKAVELGGNQLMRRQYAHCLEGLGKLDECFAQWTLLMQQYPDDPAVRFNYDRVKKLLDDHK